MDEIREARGLSSFALFVCRTLLCWALLWQSVYSNLLCTCGFQVSAAFCHSISILPTALFGFVYPPILICTDSALCSLTCLHIRYLHTKYYFLNIVSNLYLSLNKKSVRCLRRKTFLLETSTFHILYSRRYRHLLN